MVNTFQNSRAVSKEEILRRWEALDQDLMPIITVYKQDDVVHLNIARRNGSIWFAGEFPKSDISSHVDNTHRLSGSKNSSIVTWLGGKVCFYFADWFPRVQVGARSVIITETEFNNVVEACRA